MTIRFRNRITMLFFILSIACLVIGTGLTLYKYFSNAIVLPEVNTKNIPQNSFLFYNPISVFIGIFIMLLYCSVTSLIIYHSFEKTQAPDMVFFLLFLFACLCDTPRLLIPLFNLSGTFTRLMLKVGNVTLFARLLAPLALMGNAVMSTDDFSQSTDRNSLILIVTAMFFAEMIPLNTAVILPNFSVSYAYAKGIRWFSMLTCIVSAICLFFANRKNEYKQRMTIGFILLCIGYTLIFYCYNFGALTGGILLLGGGTYLYLDEVHKHYLWID